MTFDLEKLVRDVFAPRAGETATIFHDLPHGFFFIQQSPYPSSDLIQPEIAFTGKIQQHDLAADFLEQHFR